MAHLVIHFPNSSIAIDSDDSTKLNALAEFCRSELGAYHSTEDIDELTVDSLSEDESNTFYSYVLELGLL